MLDHVGKTRVPKEARLIKADIKHFFLSGSPGQLVEDCLTIVPPDQKLVFRRICTWILENQYVQHPVHKNDVLHVIRGSGMGLPCSGDIADAALLVRMDRWIIAAKRAFDVHLFVRYKDDVFVVQSGTHPKRNLFWRTAREKAGYFKIDDLELSYTRMQYLDVFFWKGPRWESSGILDFRPFRKESSRWLPLTEDSWHHPTVHLAWPRAMLETFEKHSSKKGGDSDVKRTFLETLSEHGVAHAGAHAHAGPHACKRTCAHACTSVRVRACARAHTCTPNAPSTSVNEHDHHGVQKPTIWAVFPWNRHTAYSGLSRVFRTFDEILPWNIRVAWSRGFVNLGDKVLSR